MTRLRTSAANLRLLASVYEGNATYADSTDEADGWNDACLHLINAIEALERAADEAEGVWRLPLRKSA
jgi:hypothetical protein